MVAAPPRWTEKEIDILQFVAGDLCTSMAISYFRSWAAKNGYYKRTRSAVFQKMKRLGLFSRGNAGSFTTSCVTAEILGCSTGCITTWLANPRILEILRPVWRGGVRYIHRDSWRRLAREMPEVLGGFHADRLFMLLEDRPLANAVAAQYRYRRNDSKIRCIETGRVWQSAPAAAAELHVAKSTITLAIREKRPVSVLGLSFEALREAA